MAKKRSEPTFDKQMDKYAAESLEDTDPIFSNAYCAFMSKLLKERDVAIKDEVVFEMKKILVENNTKINKDIAEIIINQNAQWSLVITEVMSGIEGVAKSVREHKGELSRMKEENDKDHMVLKKGIDRLMLRNNYWMIILRLAATGTIVFFAVKYAHDHWWTTKSLLSLIGL